MDGIHDLGRRGEAGDLSVGTGLGNFKRKLTDAEIAESIPVIPHTLLQVNDTLSDTARARCEG